MAFLRNTDISETKIGAKKKTEWRKWPKDHLCRIWGENIRSGVRYGCECNVLRNGGSAAFLRRESYRTPWMEIQMKTCLFQNTIFLKRR